MQTAKDKDSDENHSWAKTGKYGVSEANREKNKGWNHRSQIEMTDSEKREGVSKTVNERKEGPTMSPQETAEFLNRRPDPSEVHPHHEPKDKEPEVHHGKGLSKEEAELADTAEYYRKKYSEYWGEETRKMALQLYKKRGY